ncbi:MAG: 6-bladed beta-propeller, partial [Anaerolineae bacterium]|nr:6-bladed beta-propeller [Anaerolineae bacterium]
MFPSRNPTFGVRALLLLVMCFSLICPHSALATDALASDGPAALTYTWSATIGAAPQPGFADATGIDVGPDGNVYVSDATRNDIQVFTPAGAFIRRFGAAGSGPGEFREIADVAVPGDKVYAADRDNARVQVLSQAGALLGTVDGRQPVPNAASVRLPVRV